MDSNTHTRNMPPQAETLTGTPALTTCRTTPLAEVGTTETQPATMTPTGQGCGAGGSWQCGDFSHTRAHLGAGLVHSVWHFGSLHTVSHSGHRPFSQCLTGQRTSHSGLLHLIWHWEQPSSWQRVEHLGGSQIGSHT